nr:hypothetical protein CFP56_38934 [Quercus suber]
MPASSTLEQNRYMIFTCALLHWFLLTTNINVHMRCLSTAMGGLFFGTPTHLAKIAPSYIRVMDEEMPILHLSNTVEARDLDPYREVDRIGVAVVSLKKAADEFQDGISTELSGEEAKSRDLEVENILLKRMAPLC